MSEAPAFEVKPFLRSLTHRPGVYRMLDAKHKVIYVGKARDLKKRVSSYFHRSQAAPKTLAMMEQVARVEVTVANTEAEALILEYNLIKQHKPRFNVLLRDDKSFPYILITGDHPFPKVTKHRGAHARDGDYFGPFASAGAVNRTITALEKVFLLRSCSDAVFAARARPCLMHQIKRCAAPCVGLISRDDYRGLVDQTRAFLTGRSHEIQQTLSEEMGRASERLDFEALVHAEPRSYGLGLAAP